MPFPLDQIPLLLIGATMAAYWYRVLRMARKQRQRSGRAANLVPAEKLGKALRIIWAPVIVVWIAQPLIAPFLECPPAALRPLYNPSFARWLLAAIVVAGFGITRRCWKRMGKSWRMGIDPAEQTDLVFDGLFTYVRHPIYSLSAMMMAATAAALPTPLMLAAAAVHIVLLIWESAREERHLVATHGDAYRRYQQRVGRIIPRALRPYRGGGAGE
jgi:protein-S-isoprenylcysteine O-methyltransferase Ste14